MSNKNRKISGIVFLVILIIIGAVLKSKNDRSFGWTLVTVGGLGLFAVFVDWVHNQFKKPSKVEKI